MTQQHSPEPWKLNEHGDIISQICNGQANYLVIVNPYSGDVKVERYMNYVDLERIVACVNACQGIPSCVLEEGKLAIVDCKEGEHKYKEIVGQGIEQCPKCLDGRVLK